MCVTRVSVQVEEGVFMKLVLVKPEPQRLGEAGMIGRIWTIIGLGCTIEVSA